ncbi:DNA gyrase inhibitor YacG [Candidatus Liberibacter africanus]|uniref:DNA gyrase inhibitor YacG n=1 Tax=Candidatus Liberibacter africanus PTSAPSY TaxID=1277257 RepID=A0A0G3I4L1_LIBAF|nr:DNA gyrase inhibitor YacG [Candidatus Liberibacter africanus]AKK20185.1 zinc-binding protein [Candidatus Liberibacter africanus PTSAPSY]QTP63971.1 DNA gyrase inhibitor YacG [Candidatus Liberibacter africanus]
MQTLDFGPLKSICPECKKKSMDDFYPFCSMKCRSIDLSRWLSDGYIIMGREEEESEENIKDIS